MSIMSKELMVLSLLRSPHICGGLVVVVVVVVVGLVVSVVVVAVVGSCRRVGTGIMLAVRVVVVVVDGTVAVG